MAGIQDVYDDIKRQLDEGEAQGMNLEQSLPDMKAGIQGSFTKGELHMLPEIVGDEGATVSFLLKCLMSLGAVNQALVEKDLEPFSIDEFQLITGNLLMRQTGLKLSEALDKLIEYLESMGVDWREELSE